MTVMLSVHDATDLVVQCMVTGGYGPEEAALIADHLIDCELRGVSYGGLPRALSILERVSDTRRPADPIHLLKEGPSSASYDGGDQVGYLVGHLATETAIRKARETGIGVVGASNTWMTGMFSYYIEMATGAGFAAIVAGNSVQAVAPHGSTEPRFGTNPIAMGFPTSGDPVILDAGTSTIMHAEVALATRLGQPLAEGSAYDAAGAPTTDPIEALGGAFTVWGGHKGSGLAMMVQILGMLAGADPAPVGASGYGFFIIVIDPGALTDASRFIQDLDHYATSIRTSRPIDPSHPVRVPFDRSAETRRTTKARDAIEVADVVHEKLLAAAKAPLDGTPDRVARWEVPRR